MVQINFRDFEIVQIEFLANILYKYPIISFANNLFCSNNQHNFY